MADRDDEIVDQQNPDSADRPEASDQAESEDRQAERASDERAGEAAAETAANLTSGEDSHLASPELSAATDPGDESSDTVGSDSPDIGEPRPDHSELEASEADETEAEEAEVELAEGQAAELGDLDGTEVEASAEHQPQADGTDASDEDGPVDRDEDDADSDTQTLEAPLGLGEPEVTTERVVEAVLFASDAPLPLSKIVAIVGVGSARDVRNHIKALNARYEQMGASFRIEQIASGYQMLTLPVYSTWIRRLKQSKQDSRLSQAAMETLAVVAYKQPVVRADIEAIRGVSAGEMLNRLREVGLIKIVGRAEDVGRPMLYGTTKRFLEVFGLSSLEDLPSVEEMQPGQE